MTNSEQGAGGCPHDLADMDTAAHFDGICPLCLMEKVSALQAKVKDLEKARLEFRKSERELSDAYLRIRQMVNAWDTTPGGADRFEVTEGKIKEMLARVQALESALTLILPMAKGYAAAYPVGSNLAYIEMADEALRPPQGDKL
jgi:hypothetical protein